LQQKRGQERQEDGQHCKFGDKCTNLTVNHMKEFIHSSETRNVVCKGCGHGTCIVEKDGEKFVSVCGKCKGRGIIKTLLN
jgi:hypothetical protein